MTLTTDIDPAELCLVLYFLPFGSFSTLYHIGGGDCLWTPDVPLGSGETSETVYGTLLAGYPGSGMRLFWQETEGLTGMMVGDDFNLSPNGLAPVGIKKTQYPNFEGIWSWGDEMKQVLLILRNPRLAIPDYHTLLYEIHYAHDWETAYKYLFRLFSLLPDHESWERWRDYRFHEEIKLWAMYIDYWMGGGQQYWMEWDYERNGQWPFAWVDEANRTKDLHCIEDMDCYPKAVLTYEKLRDPIKGPAELNKIAALLDGKPGMTVIAEEARSCVWNKTQLFNPHPFVDNRLSNGVEDGSYYFKFTYTQMLEMREMLLEMKDKYSSGTWASNDFAQDLVEIFDDYIIDITPEIEEMESNPPPTAAPNADYQQGLVDWYKSIGRGDRYNKAKVQNMDIWPLVKHLYD